MAERSIKEMSEKERPDLQNTKTVMAKLQQALKHCYVQGVVHADIKMLNALLVDGHFRLIDMDANCVLSFATRKDDPEDGDFVGCKFSSGVLPPEMFN